MPSQPPASDFLAAMRAHAASLQEDLTLVVHACIDPQLTHWFVSLNPADQTWASRHILSAPPNHTSQPKADLPSGLRTAATQFASGMLASLRSIFLGGPVTGVNIHGLPIPLNDDSADAAIAAFTRHTQHSFATDVTRIHEQALARGSRQHADCTVHYKAQRTTITSSWSQMDPWVERPDDDVHPETRAVVRAIAHAFDALLLHETCDRHFSQINLDVDFPPLTAHDVARAVRAQAER